MIRPGTYEATVVNHAITTTQKGDPQAQVQFSLEDSGRPQMITWYGSFSDKAAPYTIKALIACGLEGNNPAGPLKLGQKVSIVIENEIDEGGKERTKVRWVNPLGAVRNVMAPDQALSRLSALTGQVMLEREKMGIKSEDEFGF